MNWVIFLEILIAIESGGNNNAIGDIHLKNKAYGCLQIRKPYLDDVNKRNKKFLMTSFGRLLEVEDMKNPTLAKWVTIQYLNIYGKKFIDGPKTNWVKLARIHNGGPVGYRKKSTIKYAKKFKQECLKRGISL